MLTVLDERPNADAAVPTACGDLMLPADPEPGGWRMGYGACSVSGCACASFKSTYGSDLCNNCGHKYTDHW